MKNAHLKLAEIRNTILSPIVSRRLGGGKETVVKWRDNTLSCDYVKLLRFFLLPIGCWPGEELGERVPVFFKIYRKFGPVFEVASMFGQCTYLFKFYDVLSFYSIGHCYILIFLAIMTVVRLSLPSFKSYGKITQTYLLSFHLAHNRHKNDINEEVFQYIEKVSRYFSMCSMTMTVLGFIFFNVSPLYQNFKNGVFSGNRKENTTLDYSLYLTFPGFDPLDYFVPTTILITLLSYQVSFSICGIDLMLSLMIFQIIGQIQVLRKTFEKFPIPMPKSNKITNSRELSFKMFDDEENKLVHNILKDCVNHHKMIATFTLEVSTFFGPVLGLNYAFHLVSLCLMLLECSRGDIDVIILFVPLTCATFGQLIQHSVIFEIVGTVSEKLPESAYEMPWECMDTRNRRTVCILLHRLQTPINVTAMGLIKVGVTTMAGILKTTFSYFAFLRSISA